MPLYLCAVLLIWIGYFENCGLLYSWTRCAVWLFILYWHAALVVCWRTHRFHWLIVIICKFDFVTSHWFKPSVMQDTKTWCKTILVQVKISSRSPVQVKIQDQASQAYSFKLWSYLARLSSSRLKSSHCKQGLEKIPPVYSNFWTTAC